MLELRHSFTIKLHPPCNCSRCTFVLYTHPNCSSGNIETLWNAIIPTSSPSGTPQTKERNLPLPAIPSTGHRRERHSAVPSHQEPPPSIKLPPPPGDDESLPRKVTQMRSKQTAKEYVPRGIDPVFIWVLNVIQATGHSRGCGRRTSPWSFEPASAKILAAGDAPFQFLNG